MGAKNRRAGPADGAGPVPIGGRPPGRGRTPRRRGPGAVRIAAARAALGALLALAAVGSARAAEVRGADPALAGASNEGGVLLLHYQGRGDVAPGSARPCDEASLARWDEAVTRIPGNGIPGLVVVYAAFPPESTAVVSATAFGVRYSANVKVHGYGACNGDGLEVPNGQWPGPGGGVAAVNNPYKRGNLIPIYWFSLSCAGPGTFELTPNPASNMAGRFANDATVPRTTPITDFGRVGFDLAGYAPAPGRSPAFGGCCVGECLDLSEVECRFYGGLFLGGSTDCSNDPCGPYPLKGACCLPDGRCVMSSLVDCAKAEGTPLGETVRCEGTPCPGTGR